MAYINNGYARNTVLTVAKGDYSHDYSLLDDFEAPGGNVYSKITAEEFAQIDDNKYEERRDDFILYVCSLEDGLASDCPDMTEGSVEYDTIVCPLTASRGNNEPQEQ